MYGGGCLFAWILIELFVFLKFKKVIRNIYNVNWNKPNCINCQILPFSSTKESFILLRLRSFYVCFICSNLFFKNNSIL